MYSIASLAVSIITIIGTFVYVGYFKGVTEQKIISMTADLCRIAGELEKVKEEHRNTADTVIKIMAGIEYIKDSISDVKKSVQNIESRE